MLKVATFLLCTLNQEKMKSKQALGNRDHRGNRTFRLSPSIGDQAFDPSDFFLTSLETKDFFNEVCEPYFD